MLKFCKSVCKAFDIIFKSCLTQDFFSSEWKAGNVLIHKKKKKKTNSVLKTTYLSLLFQTVAKFLKVLFDVNTMFPYITLNHLISENQSELKVGL